MKIFCLFSVSFFATLTAASRRVTFSISPAEDEQVPESYNLVEALRTLEAGPEILENMVEEYDHAEEDLTDSQITSFLVYNLLFKQISTLHQELVVDEEVLEALDGVARNHNEYQLNFVFKSFPKIVQEPSLRLMAQNVDSFGSVLCHVANFEPEAFVNGLPAIKSAISDERVFMDLMWLCIIKYRLEQTVSESEATRLKCLNYIVTEFLLATKSLSLLRSYEVGMLLNLAKTILVKLTIRHGCLEFLRILLASNVFKPEDMFSDGSYIMGNAFMFVHRNAEIFKELLAFGVPLSGIIQRGPNKCAISIFTYLFLQGDAEINSILWTREYPKETYQLIAKESVTFASTELSDFVLSKLVEAQAIINVTKGELKAKDDFKRKHCDLDDEELQKSYVYAKQEHEELEDSGFSHHGFGGVNEFQIWEEQRSNTLFSGVFDHLSSSSRRVTDENILLAAIELGQINVLKVTTAYPFSVDCTQALFNCKTKHGMDYVMHAIEAEPRILLSDIFSVIKFGPTDLLKLISQYPSLTFKHAQHFGNCPILYFRPTKLAEVLLAFMKKWNPTEESTFKYSSEELTSQEIITTASNRLVETLMQAYKIRPYTLKIIPTSDLPEHFKIAIYAAAVNAQFQALIEKLHLEGFESK